MGLAAKPKRESSVTLCALFFSLLLIMGIFDVGYTWPPDGFIGGAGGESGGGGASGEWEPEGGCPAFGGFPYEALRDEIRGIIWYYSGRYYDGMSIMGCPRVTIPPEEYFSLGEYGEILCECFAGVSLHFQMGEVTSFDGVHFIEIRSNEALFEFIPLIQGTLLEYPIGSSKEVEFTLHSNVKTDEIYSKYRWAHSDNPSTWLTKAQYEAQYPTGSDYCGCACYATACLAMFSYPIPWFGGGARGGAEGQLLEKLLGLPMSVGAIPAVDLVSKNARRSRRHRLLGGSKEIL
jgi:hypothetical protein